MTSSKRPFRFAVGLRQIKSAIKRCFREACGEFDFLDWPGKQYVSDGAGGKLDDGYNHEHIKIGVFV